MEGRLVLVHRDKEVVSHHRLLLQLLWALVVLQELMLEVREMAVQEVAVQSLVAWELLVGALVAEEWAAVVVAEELVVAEEPLVEGLIVAEELDEIDDVVIYMYMYMYILVVASEH